ncbi:MAG: malonyl-ACP O-methyltransferase BioC [Cyanobacteria bacterium SIG28]|nr:malonyl-ACP O-methyltransferase BioC [Cyanobacteria bacterium SIG28]
MNKELIQARFAKNLSSYNENAKIQKCMAERLVSFITPKENLRILEIGCGTGFLTKLACQKLNYETYIAIDIVEECRDYISQIDNKIVFLADDIENYIINTEEKFDLIISNASLQWVDNFENTIRSLKSMLSIDGELIFSSFGKENFREFYQILGTTLDYYSSKEIKELFTDLNIITEEEIRIMAFSTPKDVLKHLQMTGVNAIESKAWTKKDLKSFENAYQNLCSRRPTLTYNPIYIKINSRQVGNIS